MSVVLVWYHYYNKLFELEKKCVNQEYKYHRKTARTSYYRFWRSISVGLTHWIRKRTANWRKRCGIPGTRKSSWSHSWSMEMFPFPIIWPRTRSSPLLSAERTSSSVMRKESRIQFYCMLAGGDCEGKRNQSIRLPVSYDVIIAVLRQISGPWKARGIDALASQSTEALQRETEVWNRIPHK